MGESASTAVGSAGKAVAIVTHWKEVSTCRNRVYVLIIES